MYIYIYVYIYICIVEYIIYEYIHMSHERLNPVVGDQPANGMTCHFRTPEPGVVGGRSGGLQIQSCWHRII